MNVMADERTCIRHEISLGASPKRERSRVSPARKSFPEDVDELQSMERHRRDREVLSKSDQKISKRSYSLFFVDKLIKIY